MRPTPSFIFAAKLGTSKESSCATSNTWFNNDWSVINSDNENYGDSLDSSNNVSVIKKSEPIDIPNTNSNIIHNWCSNSTPKYNNSHLFNQFSNNAPSELIGKNEKKNIEEEFVILEDKEIKNTDDK